MNMREAILRAASQIERHPETFSYASCELPACGTPGCALGWIAHFRNYAEMGQADAELNGPTNQPVFYFFMNDAEPRWMTEAAACARGMRAYADKYHPAEKPTGIPANVRAIFETERALCPTP